jgi:hypothetical protein
MCEFDHGTRAHILFFQHRPKSVILLRNRLKSTNELAVVLRRRGC